MSAIAKAIDQLVQEAPQILAALQLLILDVARTVVLPMAVTIVGITILIRIMELSYRIIYPPTAEQLHKEALGCLKKGDNDTKSHKKTKALLQKAIERDPMYIPSHLSLIALLLYTEEDHVEAMRLIHKAQTLFPNKNTQKELKQLELDAKAIRSNLRHMVLAGSFPTTTYLGEYASYCITR